MIAQHREPCHKIAVIKFDPILLSQRGCDDAVAFNAGEHPVRMAAGSVRVGAFGADGTGFRGERQHVWGKLQQNIPHLPRKRLVRAARGKRCGHVRDIADLGQRGKDQCARI